MANLEARPDSIEGHTVSVAAEKVNTTPSTPAPSLSLTSSLNSFSIVSV